MGTFSTEGQYTYQGKKVVDGKSLDEIAVTWKMHYVMPKKDNGLPFEITKADLQTDTAKGAYYFDPGTGRLTRFERTLRVHGTLDISINENQAKMELEREQGWVVRLLDKNPSAK
jgi:hypothetical protein